MMHVCNEQTSNTRVTWLMPIKNGMPYLPHTLASLASQTYRDFEVLVWDNGSTDGTLEELRKWIPACLPGRIVSDRPLGLGESLAAMVEEATTELCARIDADDISVPERLEKQVAFLRAQPDVAAVGTQYIRIDETGETHGVVSNLPLKHEEIVLYMSYMNPLAHPAVLFRRSAVLAAGNYRHRPNIEDYDLWLRLAAVHRLANMNEALLHYRIHNQSTTQIAIVQNRLQNDAHSEQAIVHAPNRLKASLNAAFAEHAPALLGCSSANALRLRERTHRCALGVLFTIARHRAQAQKSSLLQIMRSEAFYHAAWQTTAPMDFASRLMLAVLHPGRGAGVLKNRLKRNWFHLVKNRHHVSAGSM